MKYEEVSDFEINDAVLMLMPFNNCQYIERKGEKVFLCEHVEVDPSCVMSREEFNPCNNPSDAWPIIVENGIIVDGNGQAMVVVNERYEHLTNNKNPLRAAMIVYLKMQDEK